ESAGLLLGLFCLGGVTYVVVVIRRMWRMPGYRPDRDDWLWYAMFPLAAYITLVVAAIMLPGSAAMALFGIAAVTLVLLFIGIHNAWDTVSYMAISQSLAENESKE